MANSNLKDNLGKLQIIIKMKNIELNFETIVKNYKLKYGLSKKS